MRFSTTKPVFKYSAYLAASVLLFSGCENTPPANSTISRAPADNIVVSEGPQMTSFHIDSRDYNNIAKALYESMSRSPQISEGSVVALGPVVYNLEPGIRFDHRSLAEKIQTNALRGGLMNFTFAVDANTATPDGGPGAAAERMKIMQLRYEQSEAIDPEDLMTYGQLAEIGYLLFGRVSSRTNSQGSYRETTYTFNWKLGNCKTGVLVWADEFEYTKRTR